MSASRPERRHVIPNSIALLIAAAKKDAVRAAARYESAAAVIGSHTVWEHEDGRDLCDFDGQDWPCSALSGIAFIYDVEIPERWVLDQTAKGAV